MLITKLADHKLVILFLWEKKELDILVAPAKMFFFFFLFFSTKNYVYFFLFLHENKLSYSLESSRF